MIGRALPARPINLPAIFSISLWHDLAINWLNRLGQIAAKCILPRFHPLVLGWAIDLNTPFPLRQRWEHDRISLWVLPTLQLKNPPLASVISPQFRHTHRRIEPIFINIGRGNLYVYGNYSGRSMLDDLIYKGWGTQRTSCVRSVRTRFPRP